MMRWLGVIGAWLVLVAAGPAELPPPDFPGRQYIDSSGCVFLRDEGGWTARLDPAGDAVCGYPPTRLAGEDRRPPPAPASDPRLIPPGMGHVEGALLAGVMNAAQSTEPLPRGQEGEAAAPDSGGIGTQIAAGMVLARRLASASAVPALVGDSRLCALIGASPPGTDTGMRETLGYCGAAAITATAARPTPIEGSAHGVAQMRDGAGTETKTAEPGSGAGPQIRGRSTATVGQGRKDRQPNPAREARVAPVAPGDVIPAGARYFVLSRHGDEDAVRAAARRLVAAGFPAAIASPQAGGERALMAGPFSGREAMVRALDRLRRAGYRNPIPR